MQGVAAVLAEHELDDLGQESANVVLDREVTIAIRRNPPIDQVNVETALEIAPHDALVGLEVEDVMPVDQGVAKDHRLGVGRRCLSAVAKEPERSTFEN